MLNVWTQSSGSNLGTLQERQVINLTLPTVPLIGSLSAVTFTVISGRLPSGLRLIGNLIKGTTFEVERNIESAFVIRAQLGNEISDRTFKLTVQGPDVPVWITTGKEPDLVYPESTNLGLLPVNPNGQAFVLDNTYVDFQLQAIDTDLSAGGFLEFFIQDGDGQLPPGLELTTDGRIVGKIDPILALDVSAGSGFFDTNLYDTNPFDFGEAPRTGLDTFLYDTFVYDYFDFVTSPRKLNRNYEFTVSVSDGVSIVRRKFRIFVVGEDFFRADNTIMQVGDGAYTADATYLRAPFWLNASNLGIKRANNYVTIMLDAFDPLPEVGPLVYELASTNYGTYQLKATGETVKGFYEISGELYFPNADVGTETTPPISPNDFITLIPETLSTLPDGLFLDANNGEIFGFIPYQPAITKDYKFTVNAIKYDASGFSEVEVAVVVGQNAAYGQNYLDINPLGVEDQALLLNQYLRIGNFQYQVISYTSQTVIGGNYARITFDIPLKINVPAFDTLGNPTVFTKTFIESTLEFNTVISPKTFTLSVLGEVDSVIRFITPSNLGTIKANFESTLAVNAETSVPQAVLYYQLVSQNSDGSLSRLPPGLELKTTGELVGKVRQFGNLTNPGLTIFDQGNTTFDGDSQSYDRTYKFTVLARDQFLYSAILREFTVTVTTSTNRLYSNIYAQPFPTPAKRLLFSNFINDSSIFTPDKIYRFGDPAFGLQTNLKMLVFAGIETRQAREYITALNRNAKRKRFRLGTVKKAVAKTQGTNDISYEIIYLEVLDDYEVNGKTVSTVKLPTYINSKVLSNQTRIPPSVSDLNKDVPERFRPVTDPLTTDNSRVFASGSDQEFAYPISITNIRNNIKTLQVVGEDGSTIRTIDRENEFLPLWMTTPQNARTAATGFVKAIPLCYCKPGEGDFILANIQNAKFDFSQLDYEIDRFIIDSTTGNSEPQFLKFTNYRYNV